jgi:hypothetical protein
MQIRCYWHHQVWDQIEERNYKALHWSKKCGADGLTCCHLDREVLALRRRLMEAKKSSQQRPFDDETMIPIVAPEKHT